jgi:hypothetical protein
MLATRRLATAGVLWLALSLLTAAAPGSGLAWATEATKAPEALPGAAKATETPNDVARFLAGLEPLADSALAPLARDPAWQQHAKSLDAAWSRVRETRLSKIRAWSSAHLTAPQPTVLYMFSGPDYLYMDAFFHDRTTYVMSGLEQIGAIPSIASVPRKALTGALGGLRASVGTALNYSFFITAQMQRSLHSSKLNGVLPVIYLFLARSGKTIKDVSLFAVDKDGAVVEAGTRDAAQGVKIVFTGSEGKVQTLYYFQTDLSDGGVRRSGFLKFCEQFGKADVFIKSASYLLHNNNFAIVRAYLLEHGAAVVQDDTGIPVRYFTTADWQLQPFGRYLGPIAVFPGMFQKGLNDVFRKSNPPRLEFGVGYRWRPQESNLLLAVRSSPGGVAQEIPRQK